MMEKLWKKNGRVFAYKNLWKENYKEWKKHDLINIPDACCMPAPVSTN